MKSNKYLLEHSIHFHCLPNIKCGNTYIDTSETWLFRDCLITLNTHYYCLTDTIAYYELLVQPDSYTWLYSTLNLNQTKYFLRCMSKIKNQQELTHLLSEFSLV